MQRSVHSPLIALGLLASLVLSSVACSTAATVTTARGEVAYGTLLDESDAERIVMELDDGRRVAIKRERVASIEHPGYATRNVGIVLAIVGLAGVVTPIIGSAAACSGEASLLCSLDWLYAGSVTVPLGAISFFSGTGMALWGAGALSDSERHFVSGLEPTDVARGVSWTVRF